MWRELKKWALLDPPHSLAAELKPWGPQSKRAARFWATLIALLFASHWLARVWVFEYAGLWSADALAHLHPAERAEQTGIVAITPDEHQRLLSGASPIPAFNLRQAVCAVLRTKPKVLGIDLDTSHVEITALPHTATKIVWARGIRISRKVNASGIEEVSLNQDYLLGHSNLDVLSGLAVVPVMPDWPVRTIPACVEYDYHRVMPTMIAALVSAAGRPMADCVSKEESFELGAYRIHYHFDRFTLADFAPERLDKAALDRCQRGEVEWREDAVSNHPLMGKVVLLGGEYDPQDWHPTPYGLKPGVEVLASMTEHWLRGSADYEIEVWKELGLKLVLALAIAWIHSRFRPLAALMASLTLLFALVLVGGVLAVYLTAYRATVVPFLLGIVLEQLVTSAHKAQEGGGHAAGHPTAPVGAGVGGAGHP